MADNAGMRSIALVCGLILSVCASAKATPQCTPLNQDIPVRETLASAGFFANLRNADHSVRYLMDALLRESESAAGRLVVAEATCVRGCADAVLAVVFSSKPHMTLAEYDERDQCDALYTTTQRHPITFLNRSFDEQEQVEDWYKDLTQGDGDDGEQLYQQCPGRCSPEYSSLIFRRGEKFVISTSVVCGHARDRDDNQYALRAAVRWVCPNASSARP